VEEPSHHESQLWSAYLSFYRREVADAVLALDPEQRRVTLVPSGWTPIELLSHVLHMEQRWFVWGFLEEEVEHVWGDWSRDDPWDDSVTDARWRVADDVTAEDLAARLRALGERVTEILTTRSLDEVAPATDRFDDEDPPTLEWICFHVLHEYARHAGHLDISVELARG
jgi:uncharacterized damage-inducible protein DinB